ncbi:MAG: J domain-containing protein [Emcibacteraceae bacterium]|nr:J domain-containing protein [Emcibacteraceae bacterium]
MTTDKVLLMNSKPQKRECEWQGCQEEGRYRIQASADREDIHWFCRLHARTFDLSVVSRGPFIGSGGPNWTKDQDNKKASSEGYRKPYPDLDPSVRIRHVGQNNTINYTREDIEHLKILGLDTGANIDDIKKAYKTLVKHCHPDQNPVLEHGNYIFTKITEAYNALKDKEFN